MSVADDAAMELHGCREGSGSQRIRGRKGGTKVEVGLGGASIVGGGGHGCFGAVSMCGEERDIRERSRERGKRVGERRKREGTTTWLLLLAAGESNSRRWRRRDPNEGTTGAKRAARMGGRLLGRISSTVGGNALGLASPSPGGLEMRWGGYDDSGGVGSGGNANPEAGGR